MQTLFSEISFSLSNLLQNIDLGQIGLPDIQRPFIWKPAKVRDLFDSMYSGFPVGYLLFWRTGVENGARQIGMGEKQVPPSLLIVDGQQRLTSLYAVMRGVPVLRDDFSERRIHIAFRPRDGTFEVADAAIRKDPEFLPDISVLWSPETQLFSFTTAFIEGLRKHRESKGEEFDDEEEARVANAIGALHNLQNYPFTALSISSAAGPHEVSEIFVRVNSKGVTLKQSDFILTLMSVFWDEGRKELERFCRDARMPTTDGASPFNYFIHPDPDQLLRSAVALGFRRARLSSVYSLLRGRDVDTDRADDERRDSQFRLLSDAQAETLDLTHWHEFFKAVQLAGYRGGWMISSETALVYSYAMFLIARRDYGLDVIAARRIIARWFFMTALTARYSSSPESTMEQDLNRLQGATDLDEFTALLDRIITDTLTGDFWEITLPNDLATSAARSPALFAYYAALNLLDAKALFSRMKVSELMNPALKAKKAALERHHLFPRAYLKGLGIDKSRDINQIANYAVVEWPDNITISDRPPHEYFPEMIERARNAQGFDDGELDEMYDRHALWPGWEALPYEQFLPERRRRMADVIRQGFDYLVAATGAAAPVHT